jgi:hypothetical protein
MGTEMEKPQKMMLSIDKAIELELINSGVRTALKEFWKWFAPRYATPYAMSADVELDTNHLSLHIYYDVTEKVDECIFDCVEQTKKYINKVDENKIEESCQGGCFYDVAAYANAMFDDIREKLFKCLDKYSIKYSWKEGWVDNSKYLQVDIFS